MEENEMTEFDVLLSFAGTERDYALAIADICKANGLKVFLDEDLQHEIWGKNLVEYLDDAYKTRGKYCVALISKSYCSRSFPKVERHSAFDRMIESDTEYFLPICIDDEWPKGLPKATAYLDLRTQGVIGICEILVKKVTGNIQKLIIPPETRVPRVPNGQLKASHLRSYLLGLCQRQPITVFGTVVYDEKIAEVKKLFLDKAYWNALDEASGSNFEIFAIRDEEDCQVESEPLIGLITDTSQSSSRSKTYYFSKLLKDYFGKERTRMAYPSVLLFIVVNGNIQLSRLIPFRRGTIEEIFLRLQELFSLISNTIAEWEKLNNQESYDKLWNMLKTKLLDAKYTLYIQNPPVNASDGITELCEYIERIDHDKNS